MKAPRLERIAVFIDGENLYGTCISMKWQIDFAKLIKFLELDRILYNAFYYTAWDEDSKRRAFSIFLTNQGYTVRKRELQRIYKGDGFIPIKTSTDIMMVMDMILTKDNYDAAILVSGNRDFIPVIEYLRWMGKRVVGLSSKSEAAAIDLVNAVDEFINFDDIKEQVERDVKQEEEKSEPAKENPNS